MRKRVISLLLALVLLLPMVPVGAQAAEKDELKKSITEQYDAYAASIAQPNADEAAIRQLLNHSIDYPGQTLVMDESDPLTASIFQSALFRNYMIKTLDAAVNKSIDENADKLLIGSEGIGWHDYTLRYQGNYYEYNESQTHKDDILKGNLFPSTVFEGTSNAHDKAMILVVGGMTCRIHR